MPILDRLATSSAPRRRPALRSWPALRAGLAPWIGRLALLVGLVDVAWAVLPGSRQRLAPLLELLPDTAAQTAVAANLVVGVLLVPIGVALGRRKNRAWQLTVAALAVSVPAHLLLGRDWGAAAASAALLALLVAVRGEFVALSAPTSRR
ncbi:MAG: hypothetical protein L0I76_24915, partial [Pseudonocardia sp.]|nr:hypothetical protein [Pseudonocardia sp.]